MGFVCICVTFLSSTVPNQSKSVRRFEHISRCKGKSFLFFFHLYLFQSNKLWTSCLGLYICTSTNTTNQNLIKIIGWIFMTQLNGACTVSIAGHLDFLCLGFLLRWYDFLFPFFTHRIRYESRFCLIPKRSTQSNYTIGYLQNKWYIPNNWKYLLDWVFLTGWSSRCKGLSWIVYW